MRYRVLYTDQFHEALDAQISYSMERSAPGICVTNWLKELLDFMDSLDALPTRFSLAEVESMIRALQYLAS